ncbi:type IV secretory system conjugative DNA transfer family protein (plasmid) [Clavibacter michiganensis subsp. michiganensis]|uniref:ATP/GTP-binding protein n=1 Tax=Clavibacter michiganensis TaxID=28447 RepID=UPI00142D9780|nr:ATP/GTP-binding protein [Clavibacter michiganensis]MDO4073437.1 ATP/GTP-binding protein [Clavibacter michiganensis]MDO4076449.1 ATP/GTP-binding protein [Clavibacter michiganensis]MDO4101257.1 ATP/GTP-binding protein [Clavibacter michiganensis]MDO4129142.1 ATP/GTP-binding protein [Clavibacter michiganensis]MDO4132128.1 ATP/GTP-binding protein [Clavibacter michiganensis]
MSGRQAKAQRVAATVDTEQEVLAPQRRASRLTRVPIVNRFLPPEAFVSDVEEVSEHAAAAGELAPWDVPGSQLRPDGWQSASRARRGWYAPAHQGAATTTRQAEIVATAHFGAPTGFDGIVNGRDTLTRTAFAHDPITAYRRTPRGLTSPNVIVLGQTGSGKSSWTTCNLIMKPLMLRKRRAVVFSKKDRGGECEHAETTRQLGNEPFRFLANGAQGEGQIINLMDRAIVRVDGIQGQKLMLDTAIQLQRHRSSGTVASVEEAGWEDQALRLALRSLLADHEDTRTPTLADLSARLGAVDPHRGDYSLRSRERLHQAGLSISHVLNDLLETYGGVFDGETSSEVDLTHKLTTFDISQLPSDGAVIPIVMAAANMWMLGRIKDEAGWATNVIYEEGWHMIGGPSVGLIQSNEKLSRSLGMSNIFIMHKGTDIPPESAGVTVIQEAQTAYIFRQEHEQDAAWAQRTFNLDQDTTKVLMGLGTGHCIAKIADMPETEVEHLRSEWEKELTDSDQAMMGDSADALGH